EMVAGAAVDSMTSIIRDSMQILFNLGYLFYTDWRLSLCAMIVAPAIGWSIRSINIRFRRYSTRIQNSMGDVTRVAKEAFDAHRVIKIFNAEDHQTERFEQVNEHNRA